MRYDIVFETSRFNLSEVKPHFINENCFGEDLAAWLCERLSAAGISVSAPDQEDWGWHFEAMHDGQVYFIGIEGCADEGAASSNHGEWRIMTQKDRMLMDKVFGRNRLDSCEEILTLILEVIKAEPGFSNIQMLSASRQVAAAS